MPLTTSSLPTLALLLLLALATPNIFTAAQASPTPPAARLLPLLLLPTISLASSVPRSHDVALAWHAARASPGSAETTLAGYPASTATRALSSSYLNSLMAYSAYDLAELMGYSMEGGDGGSGGGSNNEDCPVSREGVCGVGAGLAR